MKRIDIQKLQQALTVAPLITGFVRAEQVQYEPSELFAAVAIIAQRTRGLQFSIDKDNRFVYENVIGWIMGNPASLALNPDTNATIPARLDKGVYIAGGTGTGKSLCMELLQQLANAVAPEVMHAGKKKRLSWQIAHATDITNKYRTTGDISEYLNALSLCIQDLGQEPTEVVHMGSRLNPLRTLIEYRADKPHLLTLFTSNIPMKHETIQQRYGARAYSRLFEMANYYELKGNDRRRKHLTANNQPATK